MLGDVRSLWGFSSLNGNFEREWPAEWFVAIFRKMKRSLEDDLLDRFKYVEFVGPFIIIAHLRTVAAILCDRSLYASR